MAWVCVDCDGTLLNVDPVSGTSIPTDGSIEAMGRLANEGHRLTVFTARFTPMPDTDRERMRAELEQELASLGFPPMEVWAGATKPNADVFIDNKAITFDGDWSLALAQLYMMLGDSGLLASQGVDKSMSPEME